jgi:mannose-6-phosphate isomerase-like protein (cupin superfamily)
MTHTFTSSRKWILFHLFSIFGNPSEPTNCTLCVVDDDDDDYSMYFFFHKIKLATHSSYDSETVHIFISGSIHFYFRTNSFIVDDNRFVKVTEFNVVNVIVLSDDIIV